MILTAYETLACQLYETHRFEEAIEHARIEGQLKPIQRPFRPEQIRHLYGVGLDDTTLPPMSQPFRYTAMEEGPVYCIDQRPFYQYNRHHQLELTHASEYQSHIKRALFTLIWDRESPQSLLSLGDLPSIVFIRWLADSIVKRFGLAPNEQTTVLIITFVYWQSLFQSTETEPFDERRQQNIAKRFQQLTGIPGELALERVKPLQWIPSLEQYTEALKAYGGSTRLFQLTPGFIYSVLGGSWFGVNHKETVAVATEHPPTFLTLVHEGLESRSYRQTTIGRLVFDHNKRDRGNQFIRAVQRRFAPYFIEASNV